MKTIVGRYVLAAFLIGVAMIGAPPSAGAQYTGGANCWNYWSPWCLSIGGFFVLEDFQYCASGNSAIWSWSCATETGFSWGTCRIPNSIVCSMNCYCGIELFPGEPCPPEYIVCLG